MTKLSTANLLSIHVLILRIFVFGGATRIVGAGSRQSQIGLSKGVLSANPLPGASGLGKLTIFDTYRVSQKKVPDKNFPRRLPNGRGLRTNFQLNCEASLKTLSFPQKSSRQTSGKRPGVWRQSLQLVRSPRPLGSRQGKILSETFFWDTLYVCNRCNIQ